MPSKHRLTMPGRRADPPPLTTLWGMRTAPRPAGPAGRKPGGHFHPDARSFHSSAAAMAAMAGRFRSAFAVLAPPSMRGSNGRPRRISRAPTLWGPGIYGPTGTARRYWLGGYIQRDWPAAWLRRRCGKGHPAPGRRRPAPPTAAGCHLVVGGHDGDKGGIGSQGGLQLLRRTTPSWWTSSSVTSKPCFSAGPGVEYGVMLKPGRDDMPVFPFRPAAAKLINAWLSASL